MIPVGLRPLNLPCRHPPVQGREARHTMIPAESYSDVLDKKSIPSSDPVIPGPKLPRIVYAIYTCIDGKPNPSPAGSTHPVTRSHDHKALSSTLMARHGLWGCRRPPTRFAEPSTAWMLSARHLPQDAIKDDADNLDRAPGVPTLVKQDRRSTFHRPWFAQQH
jgi:hypothetical protein